MTTNLKSLIDDPLQTVPDLVTLLRNTTPTWEEIEEVVSEYRSMREALLADSELNQLRADLAESRAQADRTADSGLARVTELQSTLDSAERRVTELEQRLTMVREMNETQMHRINTLIDTNRGQAQRIENYENTADIGATLLTELRNLRDLHVNQATTIAGLIEERDKAIAAHHADVELIAEDLKVAARRHNLCAAFEEFVEETNPKLAYGGLKKRMHSGRTRLVYTIVIDADVDNVPETAGPLLDVAYQNLDEGGFLSNRNEYDSVDVGDEGRITYSLANYHFEREASVDGIH